MVNNSISHFGFLPGPYQELACALGLRTSAEISDILGRNSRRASFYLVFVEESASRRKECCVRGSVDLPAMASAPHIYLFCLCGGLP